MHKRLSKLASLSCEEWQTLLLAMMLLPLIALSLHIIGFKKTRQLLQKNVSSVQHSALPEKQQLIIAHCVANMVDIAARHGLYRTNCLKISFATWWLLAHKGIATELKIGVDTDSRNFNAHAWVEYKGDILNDKTNVEERFSAFIL
ncbi:MAG: lasso peptide biosynthesis B2 protein [Nitrosomonadaceae bacterium]